MDMEDVEIWEARCGQGGHIIIPDHREIFNFCIREPQVSTEHWMILAELRGCRDRKNIRYCRGRAYWPIADLNRGTMRKEDARFDYILQEVKKPPCKAWASKIWI